MNLPSIPPTTSSVAVSPAYINQIWALLARIINGNISFGSSSKVSLSPAQTSGGTGGSGQNIVGYWWTGNTGASNTNFTIQHTLGYVPSGWLLVSIDQPAILYKGSVAWSSTSITLKCNTANVNVVLLLI